MATEKKMDCAILGLLSNESLTGYQIKNRMDTKLKYFWRASFGSIYPTLNSMVQNGMITKLETKENGRDKIIYTITEDGRNHLKEWLFEPVKKDELRYETLLKLFFGSEIGKDNTLAHVTKFKEKIEIELADLEHIASRLEQIKDTEDAHLYYLLTAKFGIKAYRAYLEWCGETEEALKSVDKITDEQER
jgi:DNA-binding PadR family transcriptional regulator